jgi:rhodanese-related sulfurtransferase
MCDTEEKFYRMCEASAIMGTLQAGYTDFPYVDKTSPAKIIFERESLLGCSITGFTNNPEILFNPEILEKGAQILDVRTAKEVADGKIDPKKVTEKTIKKFLDEPDMPDVDLFVRSSGEQRLSNFLLWQSAYSEFVFLPTLWPDFDRRHLWHACEIYASRDRRYGGAVPNPLPIDKSPTQN